MSRCAEAASRPGLFIDASLNELNLPRCSQTGVQIDKVDIVSSVKYYLEPLLLKSLLTFLHQISP